MKQGRGKGHERKPGGERRRVTGGRLGLPLALGLALALPARPGQIPVTGGCTLVDAIIAANTDTAMGGCPAGYGFDTLILDRDWSLSTAYSGEDGLPMITSWIRIQGNGYAIDGGSEFRVFHVAANGDLTLESTTVRDGRVRSSPVSGGGIYNLGWVTLTDSTVSGNEAARGGGIYNLGTLTLSHSTVSGNLVQGLRRDAIGGGIFSIGTLTLANSTVADNEVLGGSSSGPSILAGGIYNNGTATLVDSTVSGNRAAGYDGSNTNYFGGGGIHNSGTLFVIRSTLSDNIVGVVAEYSTGSASGGGLYNLGTATLRNSTLSGNSVEAENGQFGHYAFAYGGGIDNHGQLTVNNTTLSGNSAYASVIYSDYYHEYDGGGIANRGGSVELSGSIVTNSDPRDCFGPITNLGGNRGCTSSGVSNFDTTLADHGGPTLTHQLWPGSNAVDGAGDCGLTIDQRGAARDAGACDSGAFEEIGCPLLELDRRTVDTSEEHFTCSTALLGPELVVAGPGGSLSVRAGSLVILKDRFRVEAGAEADIGVDAALLP